MDNATDYQDFLLELIQLINRDNRGQQNHNNPRNTQNTRYQSPDSIYRQQIYDIIMQYNANMQQYQYNMRDYNDAILYALEMLHTSRQTRNTNTSFQPRQQQNIPRNFLQSNSGLRGGRTTPFVNIFSDPVIIRPTTTQIENATRTLQYSIDLSNNTRCPITLEEFQTDDSVCEIKYCRHLFKRDSIMDWFQRNVRCPVCRYDIRDYVDPIIPTTGDSIDTSNNIPRTPSYLSRPTVNNQINTITNNISNILQNYIDQEPSDSNTEAGSNVFTFEMPIIYFDFDMSYGGSR